ncbi:uncharacterized protein LOC118880120 isoform X1 [Balaenoptera musculus]|uniref:Uncharacterized protein LOC118880120 isoform X1 n=1 Tax=Balaenoptera musculus TaxID=9771 RepID=A0A8B8V3P9_BALMU|nr:uncharacterized protein LOC118880120 isoform X1 [Balaenoptera musculus]XP_036679436.1 uncharacterized protein LOC118880120 isoform X1 [Balaenoptera musculus]XP_036679446.1 uncharacterized protein LOC118880120 isoform X1 [Balaenoptera musculus]
MGPCSEDPHLCWASRLLGFTSLLLSICCTGVKSSGTHGSGVQDSGAHAHLHRVRGGSVLFHVIRKQEANLEEVTWGFGPDSNYRVLLRVYAGVDAPTWVSLQDKYQQRVHVPSILSLKIENLTPEDSGLYRARASFTGGIELNQVFPLTVYVVAYITWLMTTFLHLQSRAGAPSPDPVQVTIHHTKLVQRHPGVQSLRGHRGPERDLAEQGPPQGAGAESDTGTSLQLLDLACEPAPEPAQCQSHLCGQQPGGPENCHLRPWGSLCPWGTDSQGQVSADPLPGILGAVVAVLLILGGGLYLWKTREKKKKMQTGRGTELQEDHRDNDSGIQYAELSQQESRKDMHKGIGEQHLEEKEPVNTVYSEVHKPEREAMKII